MRVSVEPKVAGGTAHERTYAGYADGLEQCRYLPIEVAADALDG